MKALGLVEGRDFVLEERYADGDEGRLPSLAAELIDSGVAVIVATDADTWKSWTGFAAVRGSGYC